MRPGSGTAAPGAAFDVPGPEGLMSRGRSPTTRRRRPACCTAATSTTGACTARPGRGTARQWGLVAGRGPEPDPVAGGDGRATRRAGRWSPTAGTRWSTRTCRPVLGDTWVWADGRWTARPDAAGPGPLVNAQALDHPQLGLLLVGGSDFEQETGDVWHWDGQRWLPMAPASSRRARRSGSRTTRRATPWSSPGAWSSRAACSGTRTSGSGRATRTTRRSRSTRARLE